jgi:parvulin-like peptidyl-prolyl isomerase
MSFIDLKISELKKVADSFGVDASSVKTKQEIVALLEEEGITYQMYDKFSNVEKEEIETPEIEKKKREKIMKTENAVLVKMERGNHSYQAMGHTFSQEHPFVAMSESDAQRIFDTQSGFRLATPREAQEYYG